MSIKNKVEKRTTATSNRNFFLYRFLQVPGDLMFGSDCCGAVSEVGPLVLNSALFVVTVIGAALAVNAVLAVKRKND